MMERKIALFAGERIPPRATLAALTGSYTLVCAQDLQHACLLAGSYAQDIVAVFAHFRLSCDAFALLRYCGENGLAQRAPFILFRAHRAWQTSVAAYRRGAALVVDRPVQRDVLRAQLRRLEQLYERANARTDQNPILFAPPDPMQPVYDTLAQVLSLRSAESGEHQQRVQRYTGILLECLCTRYPRLAPVKKECGAIARAAALHDIGKLAIPDEVLHKQGKLTDDEFTVMKTHTTRGFELLGRLGEIQQNSFVRCCREICLSHHERWDGGGYPHGLRGDEIPAAVQAVSVADAYDALTHRRAYKPAFDRACAAKMLLHGECGAFSPYMLDCFASARPILEAVDDKGEMHLVH